VYDVYFVPEKPNVPLVRTSISARLVDSPTCCLEEHFIRNEFGDALAETYDQRKKIPCF